MKFGLFSMNTSCCSFPACAGRIAQFAEEIGFESLWTGEHVVLPDPQVPPSRMAPEERILDPLITLSYLAARTQRIRLGTGIIVLPQRNPLVLAKEVASLDELSDGRLLLGLGAGYVEAEMRAIGVPFSERGARMDEYLEVMRVLWQEPQPAYHGRFATFSGVQAHPQRNVPIVIGGHTPAAYRRAIAAGQGWYGFALDLEDITHCLDGLAAASTQTSRPSTLGDLEISVTPRFALTKETISRCVALGVHRLIVMPPRFEREEELRAYIESLGDLVAVYGEQ